MIFINDFQDSFQSLYCLLRFHLLGTAANIFEEQIFYMYICLCSCQQLLALNLLLYIFSLPFCVSGMGRTHQERMPTYTAVAFLCFGAQTEGLLTPGVSCGETASKGGGNWQNCSSQDVLFKPQPLPTLSPMQGPSLPGAAASSPQHPKHHVTKLFFSCSTEKQEGRRSSNSIILLFT